MLLLGRPENTTNIGSIAIRASRAMEGSTAIKGPNTEEDSTAAIGRAPVILSALDRMLISIMAIVGPAKVIATRPKRSLSAPSRSFFRLDTPAAKASIKGTVVAPVAAPEASKAMARNSGGTNKPRANMMP